MRVFSVIMAFVVGICLGVSLPRESVPSAGTPISAKPSGNSRFVAPDTKDRSVVNRIDAIKTYANLDYGFQMAVPAGWRKIAMLQSDDTANSYESGFAVGFELSRQSENDQFADYILVEILPGHESGLFDSDPTRRHSLDVAGGFLEYDKLFIDSAKDGLSPVDLLVFQNEHRALGYTIDFYAIGEPANEDILFDAFQLMLRTYIQLHRPFTMG